jgi:hypothetical protein
MNDIGFEYPDYTKPVTSTEGREKRKRGAKATWNKPSKKPADDETEDDESEYDEESPLGKAMSSKKKRAKIYEKKILAAQEQGKESATTTSSLGCTRILKVMTQPLPFSTLSPLRAELTRL